MLPYSTEKVVLRNKNLFTSTVDNNEAHKRYFSSIDAEIYFGDVFIDDINSIQYAVTEKILPIYGYNSSKFDFLVQGVRVIQGEFTINFTKSGWLIDVIKGLVSITQSESKGTINQCCERTDSCDNTLKPNSLFGGLFDIIVSFGDHKSSIRSFGSSAHMIKGVKINGYSQVLDTSGEPIAETYSFIAQTIDFDIDTTGGLDNTFTTGNNNTTIRHSGNNSATSRLNVSYAKDQKAIARAMQRSNTDASISLSVLCEHDIENATIVSNIKILNSNINKEDIKITKFTLSSNDRRKELRNLPVIKTSNFRYSNSKDSDLVVTISLNNLQSYNKLISRMFKKDGVNAYIDANVSIELTYKNTPLTIINQSVKVTPGDTYNF